MPRGTVGSLDLATHLRARNFDRRSEPRAGRRDDTRARDASARDDRGRLRFPFREGGCRSERPRIRATSRRRTIAGRRSMSSSDANDKFLSESAVRGSRRVRRVLVTPLGAFVDAAASATIGGEELAGLTPSLRFHVRLTSRAG